jgi:hypothetical protein
MLPAPAIAALTLPPAALLAVLVRLAGDRGLAAAIVEGRDEAPGQGGGTRRPAKS